MKTPFAAMAGLIVLAACSTAVPNDVRQGVGFGDYATYAQAQAARQAQLRGAPSPQQQPIVPPVRQTVATPASTDSITARAAAAIAAAEGAPASTQTAQAQVQIAQAPAAAAPNTPGISDEQDFNAVAARESIESDAERRERMQSQLVIVQPTAIPERPETTGANVIDFALSTSHPVGEQRWSRSMFRQGRHQANCLAYRSDDLAQEAFLLAGGPERDRQALDPDGDGYACGWDPTVYRRAAQAARNG